MGCKNTRILTGFIMVKKINFLPYFFDISYESRMVVTYREEFKL